MTFGNVEIPRDRYGRPMVVPPVGGDDERRPYQRCTTFVGVLENTWNIQQWEARKVAEGMGQRPDLVIAASATSPEDKKGFQDIASRAKEHALGSAAATTGTALHALTERVDSGFDLGSVPPSAEADIHAYEKATFGMEHQAIEEFRVFDDWQIAGTADRVITYRGGTYIADIKTGSIEYGMGKICMQLAMYAHGLPYDIETDTRSDRLPDLSMTKALVIHLPQGQAECNLVWVDIQKGWRACGIAKQVWDWRKEKGLSWPDTDDEANHAAEESMDLMRIQTAPSIVRLRELWSEFHAAGALTPELKAAIDVQRNLLSVSA